MKIKVEELLEFADRMNKTLSPSDRLSELIEASTAQYENDELFEDELELVAAARKVSDNPAERIKSGIER